MNSGAYRVSPEVFPKEYIQGLLGEIAETDWIATHPDEWTQIYYMKNQGLSPADAWAEPARSRADSCCVPQFSGKLGPQRPHQPGECEDGDEHARN